MSILDKIEYELISELRILQIFYLDKVRRIENESKLIDLKKGILNWRWNPRAR